MNKQLYILYLMTILENIVIVTVIGAVYYHTQSLWIFLLLLGLNNGYTTNKKDND